MATSPLLNDPTTLRINGKCWLLSFQDLCLDAYRTHNSFNKTFWRTRIFHEINFPSKGGFTHGYNKISYLLHRGCQPFAHIRHRHPHPSPHVDDVLCRPGSRHHDLDPGSRHRGLPVLPVVLRTIMIFKKNHREEFVKHYEHIQY